MSSDWINIRFGTWHLHIGGSDNRYYIEWAKNYYFVENKPSKWFQVYL